MGNQAIDRPQDRRPTGGLASFGKYDAQLAVVGATKDTLSLRMQRTESTKDGPHTDALVPATPITGRTLRLRTNMDLDVKQGHVAYGLDNNEWKHVGGTFPLAFDWRTGAFQGQQIALSCYNVRPTGGYIDIDSFTLFPLTAVYRRGCTGSCGASRK